jgi:hypothetical protein
MKFTTNPVRLFAVLAGCSLAVGASAQIERVSVTDSGQQADFDSYEAAVSDDGSVIAFRSAATNSGSGRHERLVGHFRA